MTLLAILQPPESSDEVCVRALSLRVDWFESRWPEVMERAKSAYAIRLSLLFLHYHLAGHFAVTLRHCALQSHPGLLTQGAPGAYAILTLKAIGILSRGDFGHDE